MPIKSLCIWTNVWVIFIALTWWINACSYTLTHTHTQTHIHACKRTHTHDINRSQWSTNTRYVILWVINASYVCLWFYACWVAFSVVRQLNVQCWSHYICKSTTVLFVSQWVIYDAWTQISWVINCCDVYSTKIIRKTMFFSNKFSCWNVKKVFIEHETRFFLFVTALFTSPK